MIMLRDSYLLFITFNVQYYERKMGCRAQIPQTDKNLAEKLKYAKYKHNFSGLVENLKAHKR